MNNICFRLLDGVLPKKEISIQYLKNWGNPLCQWSIEQLVELEFLQLSRDTLKWEINFVPVSLMVGNNFKNTYFNDILLTYFWLNEFSGPTVWSGDSGGGFMVSVRERDIDKWYLFGIVSVGPIDKSSGSTCKSNTYTVYTDLTKHSEYFEKIIYDYDI